VLRRRLCAAERSGSAETDAVPRSGTKEDSPALLAVGKHEYDPESRRDGTKSRSLDSFRSLGMTKD
jgi:hypothetical protein